MRLFLAVALICVYLALTAPKLPVTLKINNQQWTVIYFSAPLPFSGNTDCVHRVILVSRDETPLELADTLQHEVLHAESCGPDNDVHNDAYCSPAHGEHPGIDFATEKMTDFIQQNPDAVRWIATRR